MRGRCFILRRVYGKVAIVTGAASGIGRASAELLASEGASVVVTDIQVDKLKTVVSLIRARNGNAIYAKHDVANEAAWEDVVYATLEAFGQLDIVVNNAGVTNEKPLEDLTIEDWNFVMGVNVTSVFYSYKHCLPLMKESGGSFINISSMAGLIGNSGAGPYTASKGAVRMLTKAAAVDYGPLKIRSNAIHPGVIRTPMSEHLFEDEASLAWFQSMTPTPYLGEPEDVAEGVLFLASDESKFVNGVEFPIDGGVVAK